MQYVMDSPLNLCFDQKKKNIKVHSCVIIMIFTENLIDEFFCDGLYYHYDIVLTCIIQYRISWN